MEMEETILGLCKSILKFTSLRKSRKRRHLRINRNGKDRVRFMSGIEANMTFTSKGRRHMEQKTRTAKKTDS